MIVPGLNIHAHKKNRELKIFSSEELGCFKRNLCCYIYPLRNPVWEWNIEQLVMYSKAFNGRKVITIAVGDNTVPPDQVKRQFRSFSDVEFCVVNNHPWLWEQPHFINMLRKVKSTQPDEITFYCHGKGITHYGKPTFGIVTAWTKMMYHCNLNNITKIEKPFKDGFLCVGCLKAIGQHPDIPYPTPWSYAGTFFWFKNKYLFELNNWEDIVNNRWGPEGYLGQHIPESKAYNLISHPGGDLSGALYWTFIPEHWYTKEYGPLPDKR